MRASIQEITTQENLENHAALACRLIRSKPVLQIYFRWLSRAVTKAEPPQAPSSAIKASLDSLLNPLRNDSDRATQRDTESTSLWLGSICEYVAQRSQANNGTYLIRSLAAGMLPLYRSLATGRLHEGLAQTRHRLGEILAIVGLCECLQLDRFLELNIGPQTSPHQALSQQLMVDPSNLNYLICHVLEGYNQAKDEFDAKSATLLTEFRAGERLPTSHQIPEWANPQLLWVLSNELVSSRSELVLPRSWIDTPVPWSKISEHWSEFERQLTSSSNEATASTKQANGIPVGNKATLEASSAPRRTTREQTKSDIPDGSPPEHSTVTALGQAAAIVEAAESGWESLETMDVIDRVLEEEFSKRNQPLDHKSPLGANKQPQNAPVVAAAKREPVIVPKVLIGEITNHNDPAFGNVIRRQVGVCKQEDRSICLSMVMVIADDQRENQSLTAPYDNGLSRWQQKLVNWICDHPELKQPQAFLTRDGQLILAVMDTERNAMTRVLRQGLVEVLTGKSDQSGADLTRVAIPAHFHVGMSSTCSPGASFEFEELIASAHRCLSAAQRMGSASIKSIEVY